MFNQFLYIFRFLIFIIFPLISYSEILQVPKEKFYQDWDKHKNSSGIEPYISEFGFRTLADHVIDGTTYTFDPDLVQKGDSIYVGVWLLDWFIENIHDKLKYPYILISCDVGAEAPRKSHLKLIYDPKVATWFSKNMIFTNHPKLIQIPFGQVYYLWQHGFKKEILTQTIQENYEKKHLLYLNHTVRTHARRDKIANLFCDKPYCFSRHNKDGSRAAIPMEQFWKETAESLFAISPLGLEVDCVRTWECLVLNTIPIIEHSYLDPLYENLPILLIHDWEEINEEFLKEKYQEITEKNHSIEKAYLKYWEDLIEQKKADIRNNNTPYSKIEACQFKEEEINTFLSILKIKPITKSIVYEGSLCELRPNQIAMQIHNKILLKDPWRNNNWIKEYSNLENSKILQPPNLSTFGSRQSSKHSLRALHTKENIIEAHFIDLTHFRHKIISQPQDLYDFKHSLKEDLIMRYHSLHSGDLFFGNMSSNQYVKEVLQKISCQYNIQFKIQNNFWFCFKK